MNIIIPHFKQYPLQGEKSIDFHLRSDCVQLMARKEHLTESGLNKILSLKSALNLGLSEELKTAFPNIIPIKRPIVKLPIVIDPF
jgi:hypothetical protein